MTVPDQSSEPHRRSLADGERGAHFLLFYERLSAAGIAPPILDVEEGTLLTPEYERLEAWLSRHPGADDRREMALRLVEQIEQMHQLGICHRDLHLANVVVDQGERPLIVDPDLAIDSNPSAPCYDLFGPDASGVPIPAEHAGYPANRGGVWWDCAAEVPNLASGFGPLTDLGLPRPEGSSTTPG